MCQQIYIKWISCQRVHEEMILQLCDKIDCPEREMIAELESRWEKAFVSILQTRELG